MSRLTRVTVEEVPGQKNLRIVKVDGKEVDRLEKKKGLYHPMKHKDVPEDKVAKEVADRIALFLFPGQFEEDEENMAGDGHDDAEQGQVAPGQADSSGEGEEDTDDPLGGIQVKQSEPAPPAGKAATTSGRVTDASSFGQRAQVWLEAKYLSGLAEDDETREEAREEVRRKLDLFMRVLRAHQELRSNLKHVVRLDDARDMLEFEEADRPVGRVWVKNFLRQRVRGLAAKSGVTVAAAVGETVRQKRNKNMSVQVAALLNHSIMQGALPTTGLNALPDGSDLVVRLQHPDGTWFECHLGVRSMEPYTMPSLEALQVQDDGGEPEEADIVEVTEEVTPRDAEAALADMNGGGSAEEAE